ncbi:hypothetical protein WJX74_003732 [Apatococcus lobatus]
MVAGSAAALAEQTDSKQEHKTLESMNLGSTFTSELPGDPETKNSLRQVHNSFYSWVRPTPTGTDPYLICHSSEMASTLGLDKSEIERPEFALLFSGNATTPSIGSKSYAQCYGGHQFGSWAGQLGDGRAISLGQTTGADGNVWELQLKGAGKTPYSRMADGRAVLRSSIREFVGSEAMFHLGISTTRALSLVGTGQQVMRDMFYSGDVKMEPGAVVCRVSPCWVRFGTFQLPASRGDVQLLMVQHLADYVIRHHYPHLEGADDKYLGFLREVTQRTARTVAGWQCVGFVHGVLNTDNMSILGETIDYGPYGWLERFDPNFTPNTTDFSHRRYAYQQQPQIGLWNLIQLANAMARADLVEPKPAEGVLEGYVDTLRDHHKKWMSKKLGLKDMDEKLQQGFMVAMAETKADFTNAFRALAAVSGSQPDDDIPEALQEAVAEQTYESKATWTAWLTSYRAQLRKEGRPEPQRVQEMNAANPCYVPRNHLLQACIEAAEKGDYSELDAFMAVLCKPYEEQAGAEKYRKVAPSIKPRLGVECLSCSS